MCSSLISAAGWSSPQYQQKSLGAGSGVTASFCQSNFRLKSRPGWPLSPLLLLAIAKMLYFSAWRCTRPSEPNTSKEHASTGADGKGSGPAAQLGAAVYFTVKLISNSPTGPSTTEH